MERCGCNCDLVGPRPRPAPAPGKTPGDAVCVVPASHGCPPRLRIFPCPILGLGGGCWERSGVLGVGPAAPNNPLVSVGEEMEGVE